MARLILETDHPSGTNLGFFINKDKQTDHPTARDSFSFNSSGQMVRLFARIYT